MRPLPNLTHDTCLELLEGAIRFSHQEKRVIMIDKLYQKVKNGVEQIVASVQLLPAARFAFSGEVLERCFRGPVNQCETTDS